MTQDLYETLKIKKSSSKKEINSAFKKLAIIHHPDKNGGKQTPEFDEIKRAYDTLNNANTRHMYDEFGVVPGDEDSGRRLQIIASLCALFGNIVASIGVQQLESLDLIGTLKNQIVTGKQAVTKQKAGLENKLESFKKAHKVMKKRLRLKKKDGDDFFMRALEENLRQFPSLIINAEKQISMHDEMLEMLAEYDYDFEKMTAAQLHQQAHNHQVNLAKLIFTGSF